MMVKTAMYLEELDADTGKHELQECGDDQDVADSADGHKHTLHHILWANKHQTRFSFR